MPILAKLWEDLTMDFIVGLPNSKGFIVVLVVVDRFTKGAYFSALKQAFIASQVAKVFIQNVVKLYGFLRSIMFDRDPLFLSKFWTHMMHHNGTKLLHTTTYHPKGDGQSKVVNRCLEQYLILFVHQHPHHWSSYHP